MDRLIKRFAGVRDADLVFCEPRGVAYQVSAMRVPYDAKYLEKIDAYDPEIEQEVIAGRLAMLERHLNAGATLLDIGAGSGAFVRAAVEEGYAAKGYDVIPESVERLKVDDLYSGNLRGFDAFTLWDSIEHLESPEVYLKRLAHGAKLFVSLPVFEGIARVRDSKHYRPGEHLHYWTAQGFIDWLALYGFRFLEGSTHEMIAGRDSIGAFAFVRDLPGYHEHIAAYVTLHASRHYGGSSTELHLGDAAKIVFALAPKSILDYGCGRSDLIAHFWRDGSRKIARYDPAIPPFAAMPEGKFDLIFCCDVLEHVPMAFVDQVFEEIKQKGSTVFFTISTKLARARLPDGRNAHVTLLTRDEWRNWLEDAFGSVQVLPSRWEHELLMVTGAGHKLARFC